MGPGIRVLTLLVCLAGVGRADTLRGKVVDGKGKLVAGALVHVGWHPDPARCRTRTGADGTFALDLPFRPDPRFFLSVIAAAGERGCVQRIGPWGEPLKLALEAVWSAHGVVKDE